MIVLALDVGERRIGIAISDPLGIIAVGLPTLERKDLESDLRYFEDLVKQRQVQLIVVGLPVHMKGHLGEMAQNVLDFKASLGKKTHLSVECMDERWTTVEAQKILLEGDVSRQTRKKKVDQIAAQLILQKYLERKRFQNEISNDSV